MTFFLHTAKQVYDVKTPEEKRAVSDLQMLGFEFEDWGNGFLKIDNHPEVKLEHAGELAALTQRWGELLINGNDITIENWMSSEALIGA